MTEIITDETGELISGCFYKLSTFPDLFAKDLKGAITSSWPDESFNVRFTLVGSDAKDLFDCPRDRTHRTDSRTTVAKWDVLGGAEVPIACSGGDVVVRDDIFDALSKAKLKGLRGVKCEIITVQGSRPKHDYILICFEGADITRPSVVVPSTENHCPFCKHGPLLCPSCGSLCFVECPKCRRRCIRYQGDPELDAPILFHPTPNDGVVLDGSKWDGADFLRGRDVVTRRVIDKLVELHAFSFQAVPLRTFVGACTPEQRRQIDAMLK